ncbi:MAG TPA: hypothetical protein VD997_14585 [Phycisphaerales bacterium]|nr:hypothetical protein [Phycisphaerales bacterium]
MYRVLWELPEPSSTRVGAEMRVLRGRSQTLSIEYPYAVVEIAFEGVEQSVCTHVTSLRRRALDAQDRLVELLYSRWRASAQKHFNGKDPTKLRHLRVCLHGGPCYDLVCTGYTHRVRCEGLR